MNYIDNSRISLEIIQNLTRIIIQKVYVNE